MVRGDFCLGVSLSKVTLWCFVMETSLKIGSGSCVFESSSSPELITKQKNSVNEAAFLPFVLK